MLLTAILILNPVGLDFIHSAFFASERLSRSIAQPIVLAAAAIMATVAALEWLARLFISRRRARGATTV